jgi:hypothetical protein
MAFVLVKYALVFCSVAICLALLADITFFFSLMIAAHFSEGGVAILLKRNTWIVVLALWWATSFLIALPIIGKFTRLPFHFH